LVRSSAVTCGSPSNNRDSIVVFAASVIAEMIRSTASADTALAVETVERSAAAWTRSLSMPKNSVTASRLADIGPIPGIGSGQSASKTSAWTAVNQRR
jgi:hypothetical protein